ncbi:hypothetical protein PENSTE_c014G02818 [Penicillium steckii]|uniref:AT DNA binding protein n=1 Tax=Penicillium steckii TaxID=303698 RepID=A0A1V6T1U1_9EURO|nr:hypothetical protein PENSTE_c014G02818 [Penicillium steckii]
MSGTTRYSSSSPDVLGPPGDAEYLISSPIKPFTGRQSFYSPAFSARKQTPAKRSRVSLSPAKSAHSIRFDDVLLPGSPTMKLDGLQRSPSPLKDQQDGNVSPWRIRVTLEATQDEENQSEMQLSPSRKRLRPSTVTTKVPLKDDRSPLAEKIPRGRPRKSDMKSTNGSPWPASPGNTPGRPGETPRRKRGRPPKSLPRIETQESFAYENARTMSPAPLPSLEVEPQAHFSPMDIAEDETTEPTQSWSHVDNAATGDFDSDSLGADDLPVADLTGPMQVHGIKGNTPREYGRTTYDTPIIGAAEQHYLDNENNINSTPSKMPSPTQDRRSSSVRSIRDAATISSPRTYPTPTPTSSLAEDNNSARETSNEQALSGPAEELSDPTEEHEEFDSIMESEGFTMVSLDTLTSVKQAGLGSHTSRATDNAAKVLQDRDNGRIGDRLKRKLPGISDLTNDRRTSARTSPAVNGLSPGFRASPIVVQNANHSSRDSPRPVVYPDLPPVSSPEKQQEPPQEDIDTRQSPVYENGEMAYNTVDEEEDDVLEEEEEDLEEVHMIPHSSDAERTQSPQTDHRDRARLQQEAEWHEERQTVSRTAQDAADSNRLIYIDSDQNPSDNEEIGGSDAFSDHLQSDFGSIAGEEHNEPGKLGNMEEPEAPDDFEQFAEEDYAGSVGSEDVEQSKTRPVFSHSPAATHTPYRETEDMEKPEVPEDFEQFAEEDYAGSVGSEDVEQSETRPVFSHSPAATHTSYRENEDVEEDDGYDDIWRQEPELSNAQPRNEPEPEPTTNYEAQSEHEDEDEDDDAFDDIWQQEARDNSHLSQHSEHHSEQPVAEVVSPWRQIAEDPSTRDYLSSSPAYVDLEKSDLRHLNPTQIRKLREREVDLSALLAADDTPNRARYYNGTSTPRSILRSAQRSSVNGSAIKSTSSRKPGKRVRLQTLSLSPDREPEAEQESPIFRHNNSQQGHDLYDEKEEDQEEENEKREYEEDEEEEQEEARSFSERASRDAEPAAGDVTFTPEPQRQSDVEPQGSSWFQRITSLTPRWLKAPAHDDDDDSSSVSQEDAENVSDGEQEYDQADQGVLSIQSPQEDRHYHEGTPSSVRSSEHIEEEEKPASTGAKQGSDKARSPAEDEEEYQDEWEEDQLERSVSDELLDQDPADRNDVQHASPKGPRPLAVFGFFSNEHYLALRRLYRIAKRHPERFPYSDAPGRAQIIGDWIWTSDGLHGIPISEAQFAIIDRFVHELSHADVQYGGSGQVEWTDADLHRRLISIIIGEQIRDEQKAQANRGASVDTWR